MRPDTKRCASDTGARSTTFSDRACPVDGRPCEVLEPLRARLSGEVGADAYGELVADLAERLPCRDCRRGEAEALDLTGGGVRLGKNERRILLAAPPGSKCGARDEASSPTWPAAGRIVWPEGPGRSAEEAHRRALRKLEGAALIETSKTSPGFATDRPPDWALRDKLRSRYWAMGRTRQAARLTPLGEHLVEACRAELEGGRPIRWEKHRAHLVASVRRPVGDLLGLLLREGVEGALFFEGLASSFTRDPERIRRSERKVEVLKKAQAAIQAIRAGSA